MPRGAIDDPSVKNNGVIPEEYGTPCYFSLEERDKITDYDLSANPSLEAQRDIFIFQFLSVAVYPTLWA